MRLLLLAIALLAPTALAATWTQENADPANRGRLDRAGPSGLGGAAFTSLDDRVLAQVTEGPAGLALAATLGGTVYAIDARGEIVWERALGAEVRASPAWTGEHVIVLPRGDTAHAFTAEGRDAWTLEVDNRRDATVVRMASPVEHPSGDVLLATMAGNVHRVAPNGSTAWTAAIGDEEAIETAPAAAPDGDVLAAAFVPGQEGHGLLAQLEADSGETVWQREIGAQVVAAPTVVADLVLVPLRDGNALEARSLSDGSLVWRAAFDASVTASPSIHEGLAIVGDIRGNLRALDVEQGEEAWHFHPFEDDPEADPIQSVAHTIADSVAIDGDGVAWTAYWVADLSSNCCPPQDSTDSPVYRIDAETGELLDREMQPKAHHGPALHQTGVWAGSDEEGVRAWPASPTLQIHAEAAGEQVHLLVNTDRSGDWRIAGDGDTLDEGTGRPPATSTFELEPGDHEITVAVGEARASATVAVAGEPDTDGDAEGEAGEEDTGDPPPAASPNESAPPATDETPLGVLAGLLALLVAGRKSRA